MKILWENKGGTNNFVVIIKSNKEGQFFLKEQKKSICSVEDIRFDKQMQGDERENIWVAFCKEIEQRKFQLILSCRGAQKWFAEHPEQQNLLATNLKTKPGF